MNDDAGPDSWYRRKPDRLVDATAILLQGREPFPDIMDAVAVLRSSQVLAVRAPFEPLPLIEILRQHGMGVHSEQGADGQWDVRFLRS